MKKIWQPDSTDREAYQMHGFFVVRSLLSSDEIATYCEAVDALVGQDKNRLHGLHYGYDRVFIQIHNVWQKSNILKHLSLDGQIARVASVLGDMPEVRVFLDQILYKQPSAEATKPHQDAPYLSFTDNRSLNCWIALDDATMQNGALEYFSASHNLGTLRLVHMDKEEEELSQAYPELQNFPLITVEARAGDAVFHNCNVVHQAYPNRTDHPRRAYSIQYMPSTAQYNGWLHPFMAKYSPQEGQVLDFDCFPLVYP